MNEKNVHPPSGWDTPVHDDKATAEAECQSDATSLIKLDNGLELPKATISIVAPLITRALTDVDKWLDANDRDSSFESAVMSIHAQKIIDHATSLAERIASLNSSSSGKALLLSSGCHIRSDSLRTNKIVETPDAYDEEKLNSLDERDIRDAIEFDSELKDMFGMASIDEELDVPLRDALHVVYEDMERGVTNVGTTAVKALKVLLKGHPRGFGRYYTGSDPWPRPSAEIQAEIDTRLPDALEWLRYELKEALEAEAASPTSRSDNLVSKRVAASGSDPSSPAEAQAANSDAIRRYPVRLLQGGDVDESLFDDRGRRTDLDETYFDWRRPTPGHLPIEADDDLRERIEADLTNDPLHLETLDDLKLLHNSDAEKNRVYCGSLDDTAKQVLDDLLEVSIREIEQECATVVGVVNKLIERALDIRVAERNNMLDQLPS